MRKQLFARIAASAVAFTVVCLPLATNSSAASCDDIKFIFARGSGQTLEDEDYLIYKASIKAELLRQKSNVKYDFYELGSSYQDGAKYPAISLNFFRVIGSKISAGAAFSFSKSVNQGIMELKNYTETISASCPNIKFIVAGYSQGAMVITNGLDNLNSDKFIYAATFGDPKLYLPEGKGLIPSACLGKGLSSYRIFAPNCKTYTGSLEAKKPYVSEGWKGKVGLWCKDKDLVCGAGLKFGTPKNYNNLIEQIIQSALASHTRYTDDGIYTLAAKTIVEKIRTFYPESFLSNTNSISSNRDTVILIDDTKSMYSLLNSYKAEARRLAKETIDAGGRVALYSYGDLEEHRAKRLVDFGASFKQFSSALEEISPKGGGDEEESFYSAIKDILINQDWHVGATKSIIVLTDAPALIPDRDGTTPEQIFIKTLEIDPVNVFLITKDEATANTYQNFIFSTNGQTFITVDTTSTDYLLNRPSVEFPLTEYSGKPNEIFDFTATTTGEIIKYEWDLDFDGIFESVTSTPNISKAYLSDCSGFIQLRVTDNNNFISTASAQVTVSSETPKEPTLENLKVTKKGTSIYINYKLGENTIGAVVAINDTILGFTSEENIEIEDITEKTALTLTPITEDGTLGVPIMGTTESTNYPIALVPKTGKK